MRLLCAVGFWGLGHYKMHGILKVVSQEEFDNGLAVGGEKNKNPFYARISCAGSYAHGAPTRFIRKWDLQPRP